MNEVECPECGAVLPEGLSACPHCGAALPTHAAASSPPPVPPPPLVPAPSLMPEAPDPRALVQAASALPVRVTRTVSAHVSIKVPQASVDKQGVLTPEQWERLVALWDTAMEEQIKRDMLAGHSGGAARLDEITIPWEQVGANLTPTQEQELEAGLRGLFASVNLNLPVAPQQGAVVTMTTSQTRGRVGCSAVLLVLLPLLGWLIFHLG